MVNFSKTREAKHVTREYESAQRAERIHPKVIVLKNFVPI